MASKLVYDDTCHFCTWTASFVVRRADVSPVQLSRVQAHSALDEDERDRLPEGYEECAQLLTDDSVFSCGGAVEEGLVIAGVLPRSLVEFLRQFQDYERLREAGYDFISNNRSTLGTVLSREPPVEEHAEHADTPLGERAEGDDRRR